MTRATADGVSIRGREGGGALETVTKRLQRDCRNFTKWRAGKGRGKRGGLVGCGVERLRWGAAVIREKACWGGGRSSDGSRGEWYWSVAVVTVVGDSGGGSDSSGGSGNAGW